VAVEETDHHVETEENAVSAVNVLKRAENADR